MGFPRQKYWSGLPFPTPEEPPDPEIKFLSPALAGRFFTTEPPGKAPQWNITWLFKKRNEILPFAATWMDLDITILNEVRQRKTKTISI